MYRKWFLLASGLAGLLLASLVTGVASSSAARRAAAVHSVCANGCDFTTIQAAIDAAAPGDEVRSAAEAFHEHLEISQAISLTGGWDASFSAQTGYTQLINPDRYDPLGHGRLITITSPLSTTLISIDRYDLQYGNASVLTDTNVTPPSARFYPAPAAPAPADGAAAQAARLERLVPLRGPAAITPAAGEIPDPGYGGGIYVNNASLHLSNSKFSHNVASDLSDGFGGALAVENAASLQITGCSFQNNAASSLYAGQGGAIYAAYIAPGGLQLTNNRFISNQAGYGLDPFSQPPDSNSYGGGATLVAAPEATITGNLFQGNLAAWNDGRAYGGGLFIISSPDTRVENNTFDANTGLARYTKNTGYDYGSGGGAEINDCNRVAILGNRFSRNVGSLYRSGFGGGLSLNTSYEALVQGNSFTDNWAVYRNVYWSGDMPGASGGALYISSGRDTQVLSNTFASNRAAYWQPPEWPQKYDGLGGGLYAQIAMHGLLVAGNVFTANIASSNSTGYGGALALGYNTTDQVTLRRNSFTNNLASQSGAGAGGAVFANIVSLDMQANWLDGNLASQSGPGRGGGFAGGAMTATGDRLLSAGLDGNRFSNNRAQGDGGGLGGGIYLEGASGFELINNLLVNNTAGQGSGAALLGAGAQAAMWRSLANNTFSANPGEAVLISGWLTTPVQAANNLIAFQETGFRVEPPPAGLVEVETPIDATLFWQTAAPLSGSGKVTATHSLEADPDFLNPAAGDYRLRWGSPAQDSGHSGSPAPDHDADGAARPFGPGWDRGAYEWHGTTHFLPLVTGGVKKLSGWAAGRAVDGSGVILHTADGGQTWTRQGTPGQWPNIEFSDVSALDARTAWAVGRDFSTDGPIIVRTQDGGQTWVRQQAPAGAAKQALGGVKALTAATVYAVGSGGVILKTTNGGQDWTLLNPVSDAPLASWERVDARSEQALCIAGGDAGGYAAVACSYDGGQTWQRQGDPASFWNEHMIDISLVNPWTYFTVGGAEMVVHWTSDGGQSWSRKPLALDDDANGVVAVDSAFAWVVCDNGAIYRTADGGQTWVEQPTPASAHGYYLLGVTAFNRQVAYIVGQHWAPDPGQNHAIILYTLDGGQTWRDITPPLSLIDATLRRVSFAGALR